MRTNCSPVSLSVYNLILQRAAARSPNKEHVDTAPVVLSRSIPLDLRAACNCLLAQIALPLKRTISHGSVSTVDKFQEMSTRCTASSSPPVLVVLHHLLPLQDHLVEFLQAQLQSLVVHSAAALHVMQRVHAQFVDSQQLLHLAD